MMIDHFRFERLVGWVGAACIVLCWIPQMIETLRRRQCVVNRGFLALTLIGSLSLTIHAVLLEDLPFTILNTVASIGAGINLYFTIFPSSINRD
jgi:uncharacterized protein with PQ loop repeat